MVSAIDSPLYTCKKGNEQMYKSNGHQERMTPSFLIPPFIAYQWKWVFTKTFFSDLADDVFGDALAELKPPYMCTCVYGRAYICTETHECHALNYPVCPSTYRRVGQVDSFVLLSPSGDDMSNARPNTSRTYSVSLLVLPRIDRFSMSFRSFRHIQDISTCVSTSVRVCVCHKYLLFCELLNIYTKQIIICVCHFNF